MSTSAVPVAEPSPIEAAREAFEHTRRILFPFHFEGWLTLGLVAFLDQCGSGGVGGAVPGGPPGFPGGGGPSGRDVSSAGDWFGAHLGLIVLVAAAAFLVLMAVVAVAAWIGSRAAFVYVDDVASGRAEVTRPWRAHAERANSYFAWRFGLAAGLLVGLALLVLLAALAAWLITGGGGGAAMGALLLILLVPALLVLLISGGLGALALHDFVVPLQIHLGSPCRPAVDVLVGLVKAYPVPFVIYVVLKIVFGMVRGLVLVAAACLTLCCVLLPVVTQTALQPLFFFERAWSLYLLRQMGYDLVGGAGEQP